MRSPSLQRQSSTVPGCVNHWGPLGTGAGVGGPTCEGMAALAEWNQHAAAINAARDTLTNASNSPDKVAPIAVIDALDACAAAADAMARLYRPTPSAPHDDAAVLAWMRNWLAQSKLPSPVTIGDGFRALATGLARPGLRRQQRNTVYGLAAMFASRESVLAAARGAEVERRTDDAVRTTHFTAIKAAEKAEAGHSRRNAGAVIAAAARSGHPAIARRPPAQLEQPLAAHPDPGGYQARTGRAFAAIPETLIGILGLAVILVIVGFRHFVARLGIRGAAGFSLLLLVALPASWLPLALLHAVTVWPSAAWLGFLLWLMLCAALIAIGPRLLPGRLRRVWAALFAPPTTHGSAYFGGASDAAAYRHLKPAATADALALGDLPNTSRGRGRFYHEGHILTCATTGAGKGIGAVIPNLIDYPGSAFVLDLKGENYAVTARARRAAGQDVFLIDPFAVTGAAGHALNWLDTLGPARPIVMIAGEPPYLLDRLDYRADPTLAARTDPNPMHFPAAAQ